MTNNDATIDTKYMRQSNDCLNILELKVSRYFCRDSQEKDPRIVSSPPTTAIIVIENPNKIENIAAAMFANFSSCSGFVGV